MPAYIELSKLLTELETIAPNENSISAFWTMERGPISPEKYWLVIPNSEFLLLHDKYLTTIVVYAHPSSQIYYLNLSFRDGTQQAIIKKDPDARLIKLLIELKGKHELLLFSQPGAETALKRWDNLNLYQRDGDHELYDKIHLILLEKFKEIISAYQKSTHPIHINIIEPCCGFAKAGLKCLAEALKNFSAHLYAFDISAENIKVAQAQCPAELQEKCTISVGDTKNLEQILFPYGLFKQQNALNILISSGGIILDVISGHGLPVILLQTMYNHNIHFVITTGKTCNLINSGHERTGYKLISLENNLKSKNSKIYCFVRKNSKMLIEEATKSIDEQELLDLGMSAIPWHILANLTAETKQKIKIINLSLARLPLTAQMVSHLTQILKDYPDLRWPIIDNFLNKEFYDIFASTAANYNIALLGSVTSQLQYFFPIDFYQRLFNRSILAYDGLETVVCAHNAGNELNKLFEDIYNPTITPALFGYRFIIPSNEESTFYENPVFEMILPSEQIKLIKEYFANEYFDEYDESNEISGYSGDGYIHFVNFFEKANFIESIKISNPYSDHSNPISLLEELEKVITIILNFLLNMNLINEQLKATFFGAFQTCVQEFKANFPKVKSLEKTFFSESLVKYQEIYQIMINFNNVMINYSLLKDKQMLVMLIDSLNSLKIKYEQYIQDPQIKSQDKNIIERIDKIISDIKDSYSAIVLPGFSWQQNVQKENEDKMDAAPSTLINNNL